MLQYKSHKKAFIMTALVILLCLTCLTGATLALFTSDPDDGTIGIITAAGEVKVDLVDSASMASLVGKTLEFQTSADQKKIIFEPGATFYTQGFKIRNDGSVPIKFRLSVSEDEKIDMTEFKEAFTVMICTDPKDLSSAVDLTKYQGELQVGESSESTYYLYIKMKETAGNKFQGKTYSGIGVSVYAVQSNAVN